MMNINFEYPLQWLPQQPRTKKKQRARFQTNSPSRAGDYLIHELKLLGGRNFVISSNLQVRQNKTGFYANQKVDDAGVVIYFQLKDSSKAMACDKWDKVEHNLWALYLSVQAIRGLSRWGGSSFLDGLFTGFKALPAPDFVTEPPLKKYPAFFSDCISFEHGKKVYYTLVKEAHPDVGGDVEEFKEIQKQWKQFKESFR